MKSRSLSQLSFLLLACSATAHADSGWSGNISLLFGSKSLDDESWLAHQHGEGGLLIDFAPSGWPLNIAIDMLSSRGKFDGFDYNPTLGTHHVLEEVTTHELQLGLRHYFEVTPTMNPYLGGGLTSLTLESERSVNAGALVRDEGKGGGLWLNAGIKWTYDAFNIGFDIRASGGEVELDAGDSKGGGGHAGLLVGYHW